VENEQIKEALDRVKGMVKTIAEATAAKKKLESELETVNQVITEGDGKVLEILKECNLETFKCEYGTVTASERVSYTTPKEHAAREAFFTFLREKRVFDDMVTVNYATLNSWAKEEYEAAKARGDLGFTIPGLGAPTIFPRLHKTKLSV
jgi:hypothetical protein